MFHYNRCDCDFQLQSIGDVAIDEIKLIIKDQSGKSIQVINEITYIYM